MRSWLTAGKPWSLHELSRMTRAALDVHYNADGPRSKAGFENHWAHLRMGALYLDDANDLKKPRNKREATSRLMALSYAPGTEPQPQAAVQGTKTKDMPAAPAAPPVAPPNAAVDNNVWLFPHSFLHPKIASGKTKAVAEDAVAEDEELLKSPLNAQDKALFVVPKSFLAGEDIGVGQGLHGFSFLNHNEVQNRLGKPVKHDDTLISFVSCPPCLTDNSCLPSPGLRRTACTPRPAPTALSRAAELASTTPTQPARRRASSAVCRSVRPRAATRPRRTRRCTATR